MKWSGLSGAGGGRRVWIVAGLPKLPDPAASVRVLVEQAVPAGADESAVRAGIEKGDGFKQWIINGADDATRRKVNSTPSVFVDGQVQTGATSIDGLVAQVEQAIDTGQ